MCKTSKDIFSAEADVFACGGRRNFSAKKVKPRLMIALLSQVTGQVRLVLRKQSSSFFFFNFYFCYFGYSGLKYHRNLFVHMSIRL